jgi:hypothetical protein
MFRKNGKGESEVVGPIKEVPKDKEKDLEKDQEDKEED